MSSSNLSFPQAEIVTNSFSALYTVFAFVQNARAIQEGGLGYVSRPKVGRSKV